MFDTETMGMAVWPHPQSSLHGDFGSRPLYISAGGRLLAFVYPFVEMLGPDLPRPTDESWSWASIEPPPPFVSSVVSGYAVHPDGRTVFVSVKDWRPDIPGKICSHYLDCRQSTFTFDMERHEWTHVGEWLLPFKGQAHYDRDLAAWIGLHFHIQHSRDDDLDTDGYLCCCDVPPLALGPGGRKSKKHKPAPTPHWKLSKEKLFVVDIERHIDAKLVPMGGGGGKFCLVEILTREGVDRKGCLGDGDKCVLRLTTFRVNYSFGGGGELTITDRLPAGEYKLSRYVDMFQVQAFWM